ncbi:MAG: DJ-1/PfpI family protein, partial [Lachnospiraceae bacterium]|nr:DJ-1/PfpI family protein [Lachnospiraceae bacterium]
MEVNILLFDDFDSMDAFGTAEVFGRAPEYFHINYLSVTGNIVNSMQGVKVWTEPVEADEVHGIVVIPGGKGARRLLFQDSESLRLIKRVVDRAEVCMMVSNGSAIPAQAGVLFRRKIAECKMYENWNRMFMAGISVIEDAGWVADGKFYSSSNTMTGIAMALSLVADQADYDIACRIAEQIGYYWHADD